MSLRVRNLKFCWQKSREEAALPGDHRALHEIGKLALSRLHGAAPPEREGRRPAASSQAHRRVGFLSPFTYQNKESLPSRRDTEMQTKLRLETPAWSRGHSWDTHAGPTPTGGRAPRLRGFSDDVTYMLIGNLPEQEERSRVHELFSSAKGRNLPSRRKGADSTALGTHSLLQPVLASP